MLFFLILLSLIVICLLITFIFLISTIRVKIENLRIGNIKEKKKYSIQISIFILDKIKLFTINLNNDKIKKIYTSKQLEKIDIKKIESKIPLNMETFKILKNIKLKLNSLKLYINLGTENAALTSYLIAIIAGSIGIILPHIATNIKDINYKTMPLYRGKNELNLEFEGIFSIKIVNIIYVIYTLVKKGRDVNGRASNRRSYECSYGQY